MLGGGIEIVNGSASGPATSGLNQPSLSQRAYRRFSASANSKFFGIAGIVISPPAFTMRCAYCALLSRRSDWLSRDQYPFALIRLVADFLETALQQHDFNLVRRQRPVADLLLDGRITRLAVSLHDEEILRRDYRRSVVPLPQVE